MRVLSHRAVLAALVMLLAGPRAAQPADPPEPSRLQREKMAALMAHTDRDWAARATVEKDSVRVTCGPGSDVQQAARLAVPLARRPETREFARQWYRATAQRAQSWGCLDEARHWVIEGLRAVPDDPELLLVMGALHELAGSLTAGYSPRAALASRPRQRDRMLATERDRHAALTRARTSFESALEGAPALLEARLRLGRVEWRLGRPRPARAALEAVLAAAKDHRLRYLAHLFLGRLEEDEGHAGAAEQAYRAALELRPEAQSAAVALSHLQFAAGDVAGARETMEDALVHAGQRHRGDELWVYALGASEDADRLFEALRAEARR